MADSTGDRRALYLRWRPLSFADVVGQDHVVRTLRNAVAAGSPAHAYLFSGPRGTGKTSVARILFRAVNCTETRGGDPCGKCGLCLLALESRSLDLVEIDAASNRGIDDIRDLREKVGFSPTEARYRVYIVDEAHELTAPAWDAFLKTLEEPPGHAIFVLATTEAHRIPATIVSRCQRFDFRRITTDAIAERLAAIAREEGLQVDSAAAERLARMARGGLRDAISLLDQAASFGDRLVDLDSLRNVLGTADPKTVHELVEAVAAAEAGAIMETLADLVANGTDLRLFAEDLLGQLRGLVCVAVGARRALASEFSTSELEWLESQAPRWNLVFIKGLIREVADGLARVRDAGQFQLHLELALLEACARVGEQPRTMPDTAGPPSRLERAESQTHQGAAPESTETFPGPADLPRQFKHEGDVAAESAPGRPQADAAAGEDPGITAQASATYDGEFQSPSAGELEEIRGRWPSVISWVASRNPFVASYLRPAELDDLRNGCLRLSFAYKVHFERVAESRNRSLVEQACQDVLGQPLRIDCRYASPAPGSDGASLELDDPVLRFALERFGGRAEMLGS